MTHVALALLTYVCFVLHVGGQGALSVGGASPAFLLLALSVAAVGLRDSAAVVWAAAIGLLADCISPGPLGVTMFCSTVAVFALRKTFPRRAVYSPPASLAMCALLTFAVLLASSASRSLIQLEAVDWPRLLAASAGSAVYTAMLFAGLQIACGGFSRLLSRIFGIEPLPRTELRGRYS